MDANNVVICNVHNGGHWVLAHGYSGSSILVNDPGYTTTSYDLSTIVDGQNAVYKVNGNGSDNIFELIQNEIVDYLMNFNKEIKSLRSYWWRDI